MSDAPKQGPSVPTAIAFARLAVAGALFTIVPAVAFVAARELGWTSEGGRWDQAYGFGALALGVLALVAWALWQPAGRPLAPVRPFLVARGYAKFVLPWLLALVGYLHLMHFLGQPVEEQFALRYLADHGLAAHDASVIVIVVAIAVPIGEELLFRGYLQLALESLLGARAGLLVASILFGLAHGLSYALPLTLVGLFLGSLRNRCGSLGAPMLAHALHNGLTALVAMLWPETLDWMYP